MQWACTSLPQAAGTPSSPPFCWGRGLSVSQLYTVSRERVQSSPGPLPASLLGWYALRQWCRAGGACRAQQRNTPVYVCVVGVMTNTLYVSAIKVKQYKVSLMVPEQCCWTKLLSHSMETHRSMDTRIAHLSLSHITEDFRSVFSWEQGIICFCLVYILP